MKVLIALLFLLILPLSAADKPNILWIVSEDNGCDWLGCYGNKQAQTPRLDALARDGIRFKYAYSNAPVCAVARSTILNGAYAPTQGTQHMRSRYPIEAKYKSYVSYLREAGYYCTNNAKTDYNFQGKDTAIWDECSDKADYQSEKRGKNQPFFAIYNLFTTHESSLFGRTKNKGKSHLTDEEVIVPPYLPDLPGIRSNIKNYHGIMSTMDAQVGELLDELDKHGHAEDTIIFYYSDHGGALPRGKRYLYDTGSRVPMIVLFPKKWAHLSPFSAGSVPDEPVSFVDFAPTLLSLIGQDKPEQMQGRAFLGSKRVDPAKDEAEFLYADRFDAVSTCMRRGLTTGRWKYIRRFTPYYPAAPYSNYQFGQAGWNAWREAWKKGELKPEFAKMWETPQPVEELYDTENDPWEINNLATSPEHQQRLTNMRQALMKQMIAARDSSIVPEAMFEPLARDQPLSVYVTSREVDLPALFQLAFLASAATKMDLPTLTKNLNSDDPLTRYWAAHGLRILGMDAAPAKESLSKLTKDPMAEIRITAAEALHCLGQPSFELLIDVLSGDAHDAAKARAINALVQMGANKQVPKEIYENLRKGVSRQLKPYLNSIK